MQRFPPLSNNLDIQKTEANKPVQLVNTSNNRDHWEDSNITSIMYTIA